MRLDVSGWIDEMRHVKWARGVRVEKVAICRMGARNVRDGRGNVVGAAYEEVACVELPSSSTSASASASASSVSGGTSVGINPVST